MAITWEGETLRSSLAPHLVAQKVTDDGMMRIEGFADEVYTEDGAYYVLRIAELDIDWLDRHDWDVVAGEHLMDPKTHAALWALLTHYAAPIGLDPLDIVLRLRRTTPDATRADVWESLLGITPEDKADQLMRWYTTLGPTLDRHPKMRSWLRNGGWPV